MTLGQLLFVGVMMLLSVFVGYPSLPQVASSVEEHVLAPMSFGGIALLLVAWVKSVEKRPLKTLGFYRQAVVAELFLGAVRLECLGYVLLTLPLWLLQGGTEELVTRGLLSTVTYRTNLILDLLVSSGLFAGLCLIDRDSLWGVIDSHGVWYFAQGNLFGVEVSGQLVPYSLMTIKPTSLPSWLTGGTFGTEGSIITSLVLLVASYWLYRRIDWRDLRVSQQANQQSKIECL